MSRASSVSSLTSMEHLEKGPNVAICWIDNSLIRNNMYLRLEVLPDHIQQETQLSLTNRATHLEVSKGQ